MPYENGKSREVDLEDVELNPLQRRHTRFHVNRVDSLEGRASLLGDHDPRKSLRNMTREALPRLDNYRNILSIQAAHRPSLDELHNPTLLNKVRIFFTRFFVTFFLNKNRQKISRTIRFTSTPKIIHWLRFKMFVNFIWGKCSIFVTLNCYFKFCEFENVYHRFGFRNAAKISEKMILKMQ